MCARFLACLALAATCAVSGCARRGERELQVRFERATPKPAAGPEWAWPLDHGAAILTSGFGYRAHPVGGRGKMHRGIDLAAPAGTLVRATRSGIVCFCGWQRGYGLTVMLDHGRGLHSLYGHLRKTLVAEDAVVRQGAPIGEVGATGNATGPHLHFELRRAGNPFDPTNCLP